MEFLLIGVVVLGVLGYLAVKSVEKTASTLGQNLAKSLATGTAITTVTIDQTTPQGDQGTFGVMPGDTFILNVYPAPAGYGWKFSGGGALTMGATTPTSATFTSPAAPPTTPVVVSAALFKSAATLPPTASYQFNLQFGTSSPIPQMPPLGA